MREVADASAFNPFAKVHVGLGAIEVVDGDRDGIAGWRLRNRLGLSWVSWCSEAQRRDQRGLEIAACDHGGSPFAIRCGGRYRTSGFFPYPKNPEKKFPNMGFGRK